MKSTLTQGNNSEEQSRAACTGAQQNSLNYNRQKQSKQDQNRVDKKNQE